MLTPDNLPIRPPATSRRERRVAAATNRAEMEVYVHGLDAWAETMKDQIDTTALAEAVRVSAEEEMDTYDELMMLAGDSALKQEIVLRKLALMSNKNNTRLRRRFT